MKNAFILDKPIIKKEQDKFGRMPFVERLSDNILSYDATDNLVIGLYGNWGEGKTSILNLLQENITTKQDNKHNKEKIQFIKFNPWNFKEQDELISAFFTEMYNQLKLIDFGKEISFMGKLFKLISKIITLGNYVPIVSPYARVIAPLIKKYAEALESMSYSKPLNKIKAKIESKLIKQKAKLIIFIDDIDRLNDKEINQMFQLIKLLADFPNVIYILTFDKRVIISALKDSQKEYADSYLEKIINIPLKLPEINKTKLAELASEKYNECILDLEQFLPDRDYRFYKTGIFDNLKNVRDINRYFSLFKFKYLPLKKEVDFHDFALITILELKYAPVYKIIKENKDFLCGNFVGYNDSDERKNFKSYFDAINLSTEKQFDSNEYSFINKALAYLFPKYGEVYGGHSWSNLTNIEATRRGNIAIKEKFDLYFTLTIDEQDLSNELISLIINTMDELEFKKNIINLNKEDKLNIFLTQLNGQVSKLSVDKFNQMFGWLFDVANDIDTTKSKAFMMSGSLIITKTILDYYKQNKLNTYDYIHSIIRSKPLSYTMLKIVNLLEEENGRFFGRTAKPDPSITESQMIIIENQICKMIKEKFKKIEFINDKLFITCFYFLYHSDKEYLKKWISNLEKNIDATFNWLSHMAQKGEVLTYIYTPTYGYDMKMMNELIDTEKYYKILSDCISQKMFDMEVYYRLVSFVMGYENYDNDNSYTKQQIDKYLKDKGIKSNT